MGRSMKLKYIFVIAITIQWVSLSAAQAQDAATQPSPSKPLLKKNYGGGLSSPHIVMSKSCSIYAHKIEIRDVSEGLQSIKTTPLRLTGEFKKLLDEAAKGELEHLQAPADIPTTEYFGFSPTDAASEIRLGLTTGHF